MQATVNLYRHLEQRRDATLGVLHIALMSFALLVLMLVIYGALSLMLSRATLEYDAVYEQLTQKKTLLQNEEQRLNTLSGADIKRVIREKKAELAQRRRLLAQVARGKDGVVSGIAGHLDGLGRQALSGLWLDRVELIDSGRSMNLGGYTREASLLPRYLQALSGEPVFHGMVFDVMRLANTSDDESLLRFELAVLSDNSQ